MRTRIIGIGAAGNKAAISAVMNQVERVENVLLVNSTLKDIPEDYNGKKFCFVNAYGGCGKERSIARDLTMRSLQNNDMKLEEFLNVGNPEQAELVVLVSSTEGGTGSGSVPILAKYILEVLGIDVHCFAFTGFEEDGRGLKNTVEYFQEMQDDFAVECLQNSKFMSECNNNKIKAEKAANDEFCRKVAILFGNALRDSDHNIDPTDLLKISTTPGYMVIETRSFNKIKNRDQFRDMVVSMVDESKALDLNEPSQKKLAIMININESSTDIIDYNDILIERFGMCFEKFEHIQHEEDMPEFFAFISAGSKIPTKEIEAIYDKYKSFTSRVDKTTDNFFAKKFDFDDMDSIFDINGKNKRTVNKSEFFKSESSKTKKDDSVKNKGFSNTKLKMTVVEEDENVDENY